MMSAADQFESLANAILAAGGQVDPSELHGFACGLLSSGAEPDKARWQRELAELLELGAVPADLERDFLQVAQRSRQQLRDSNFDFHLLLVDDGDIGTRSLTLGHWCQGFLQGFGVGGYKGKLPSTSKEALRDFGAIAQLDADAAQESEEAESQLVELQEYVRVAVLNVFTELRGGDKNGGGPTLH